MQTLDGDTAQFHDAPSTAVHVCLQAQAVATSDAMAGSATAAAQAQASSTGGANAVAVAGASTAPGTQATKLLQDLCCQCPGAAATASALAASVSSQGCGGQAAQALSGEEGLCYDGQA